MSVLGYVNNCTAAPLQLPLTLASHAPPASREIQENMSVLGYVEYFTAAPLQLPLTPASHALAVCRENT